MYWDCFKEALNQSLIQINPRDFKIKRYGAPEAWRERAYCYELYHQLRVYLDSKETFPYKLHGEIDKRGQKEICKHFKKYKKDCANPDFIVHSPGNDGNLIAMEVKSSTCSRSKANDDIHKLEVFINKINYEYGIFLIFGDERSNRSKIKDMSKFISSLDVDSSFDGRLYILWHSCTDEKPIATWF